MKITLFSLGLSLVVIICVLDISLNVSLGYFVLASVMLLAAAFWKSEGLSDHKLVVIQRVYSILAPAPITMDGLLEKLIGDDYNQSIKSSYQAILGDMLVQRLIVMHNGLVTIGDGCDKQL